MKAIPLSSSADVVARRWRRRYICESWVGRCCCAAVLASLVLAWALHSLAVRGSATAQPGVVVAGSGGGGGGGGSTLRHRSVMAVPCSSSSPAQLFTTDEHVAPHAEPIYVGGLPCLPDHCHIHDPAEVLRECVGAGRPGCCLSVGAWSGCDAGRPCARGHTVAVHPAAPVHRPAAAYAKPLAPPAQHVVMGVGGAATAHLLLLPCRDWGAHHAAIAPCTCHPRLQPGCRGASKTAT
jgi:hypothetical protein